MSDVVCCCWALLLGLAALVLINPYTSLAGIVLSRFGRFRILCSWIPLTPILDVRNPLILWLQHRHRIDSLRFLFLAYIVGTLTLSWYVLQTFYSSFREFSHTGSANEQLYSSKLPRIDIKLHTSDFLTSGSIASNSLAYHIIVCLGFFSGDFDILTSRFLNFYCRSTHWDCMEKPYLNKSM